MIEIGEKVVKLEEGGDFVHGGRRIGIWKPRVAVRHVFFVVAAHKAASATAALQLQEATTVRIAAENVEVLPVICKGSAANLAKDVNLLLEAEHLGVDNVDKIGLLGGDQHGRAASEGRETQATSPRHLRAHRTQRRRDAARVAPASGIPDLHSHVLEASGNGPAVVGPVTGKTVVAVASKLLQHFARVGIGDEDIKVIAYHGSQASVRGYSCAVEGKRIPLFLHDFSRLQV